MRHANKIEKQLSHMYKAISTIETILESLRKEVAKNVVKAVQNKKKLGRPKK